MLAVLQYDVNILFIVKVRVQLANVLMLESGLDFNLPPKLTVVFGVADLFLGYDLESYLCL